MSVLAGKLSLYPALDWWMAVWPLCG